MSDTIKCEKCGAPMSNNMALIQHMKKKKCGQFVDKDGFGNVRT